jgi:hypothetical protein
LRRRLKGLIVDYCRDARWNLASIDTIQKELLSGALVEVLLADAACHSELIFVSSVCERANSSTLRTFEQGADLIKEPSERCHSIDMI